MDHDGSCRNGNFNAATIRADTIISPRIQRPRHVHISQDTCWDIDHRLKCRRMENVPWLDTYNTMWGLCSFLGNQITNHAASMFISEVHANIDTSPCRSNIQSRPKGNEGLASLVGLAHAGRAGPSHPRSGGIVPRSSVARNTHGNTKRRYNKLPVWLQDYPLKDTYHYYYHLGWGGLGGVSSLFIIITYQIQHDPWKMHIIAI